MNDNCEALIAILQLAYSGELAAAYAYRGHWRSLLNAEERERIQTIENDEWHHRHLIGEMLQALGAAPNRYREIRASILGRGLALSCHFGGWLAPMFGAGRLESGNIIEYETAARHARDCGHPELVDCLLTMAEVEWDHEQYFRSQVLRHRWAHRLPIWPAPLPKETIRARFYAAK